MQTKDLRKYFPPGTELALLEEISTQGVFKKIPEGERLMDYGQYVKGIPIILQGVVKVFRQSEEGEVLLYYLDAGSTCPMSFTCCMMDKRSEVRAEVEDEALILQIPIEYMDIWMDKYRTWKNFVINSYNERLQELLRVVDSIAFKKTDERLWDYLQKKSAALKTKTLHITHQQIANEINTVREAVSRLLKKLENQGKIELGRNRVELLV